MRGYPLVLKQDDWKGGPGSKRNCIDSPSRTLAWGQSIDRFPFIPTGACRGHPEKEFQDWTLRYEHPLVRTRTVLRMGMKLRRCPHPGWSIKHNSRNERVFSSWLWMQRKSDSAIMRSSDQNVGIPWCSSRGVTLSTDQQGRRQMLWDSA